MHRIANRLGWVKTRLPEETEQALYRATDRRWWPLINLYLVTWGQNVAVRYILAAAIAGSLDFVRESG